MIKKILNNNTLRMITALTVVGIFSGAVLVLVHNYTVPKIEANKTKETETAIKEIFPSAAKIAETVYPGVFKITGHGGTPGGYAFIAAGNGYQGEIKMIVGVDAEMTTMLGMQVLESQETPGLGAEIVGSAFRDQFKGLSLAQPITYIKNQKPEKPGQIEAITGATISSKAVVNTLNKRIEQIRKKVKDK
ncbi:MAG: RnfABCDGE type electron transport complex subunit G [Candidatus Tantalella remota]|nr:RnfABCDGE type electron transport complex subunit G [Candidatus Tantalella remota]